MHLIKKLEQFLLDLAWSMWTELGVQGHKRMHQDYLIPLEELVIFTSILASIDPRLRDESLDWCKKYHSFISISRLKSITIDFNHYFPILKSVSKFSSTLNFLAHTHWPVLQESTPLTIKLSGKSFLRPLESPALLNLRTRSLFGTGARADLITFFLTSTETNYSISDTVELGYSKRNLAEILEELWLSGIVDKTTLRNQLRYRLLKKEQLIKILGPLPKYAPKWRDIFQLLLSIQFCLKKVEHLSESTQVVEIRNLLINHSNQLKKLELPTPIFEGDIAKYFDTFSKWLLKTTSKLSP